MVSQLYIFHFTIILSKTQLWIKYNTNMNTILTKLMASRAFQDGMGVLRGAWRIIDAATTSNNSEVFVAKQDHNITTTKTHEPQRKQQTSLETNNIDLKKKTSVKSQQQQTKKQNIETSPALSYKTQLQSLKRQNQINLHPTVDFKQPPIAKRVPKTSTSRAFELSKLGMSLAGSSISSFVQKKLGLMDKDKPTLLTKQNAKLITETLCKMRGAPLKLAQALSIQQDKLIPKQIREAFEKARDQAYIIPNQQVEYMMVKSFGQDYKQKFFASFQQKPFAASSIGQVHKGILKDGRKVAIKIQYPNVKQSIDSDLQNIKVFLGYTGLLPATLFLDRIISNTRQQLLEECDYITEAIKQRKYKQNLKYQDKYYVPEVIDHLCSSDVMTSEFIEGVSMNALEEFPQEVRDQIAERVMSITFYELFIYNFMQTDPNPSNFFYDIDKDTLNLIDFGAARSYDQNFVDYYWQVIKGAVEEDDELIWKASIKMGFVTGEENQLMKKAHIDSIKIVGEPWKYKGKFDFGNEDLTGRIYKTMPVMLKNRLRPPPPEVYSLHRKLSGSYLLCIRLRARVDTNRIYEQIKSVYRIRPQNIV